MGSPGEGLVLDASVAVKWFKAGERLEEEARTIWDMVLGSEMRALTSEWLMLEVVRAIVKAGFPAGKVDETYMVLREMDRLGFLEVMPVGEVLDVAKDSVAGLGLYASDSVYLAASIVRGVNLVTDDRHLLRAEVREYARERGVEVRSLKDWPPSD